MSENGNTNYAEAFADLSCIPTSFEENEFEEKHTPNCDDLKDNCTYVTHLFGHPPRKAAKLSLPKQQALYLCLTCCPKVREVLEKCARICVGCSNHCHEKHELVEFYTKRNLLCDCPTKRFSAAECTLKANIVNGSKHRTLNGHSNQSVLGLNSTRKRPYPDAESNDDFTLDATNILPPNDCQAKPSRYHFPYHLIGLMYQLDLTVLCLFRKSTYERKYPALSLSFESAELSKFNNFILHNDDETIHVQVEYVDKLMDTGIGYNGLFGIKKNNFCINNYFDCFIMQSTKLDKSLNDIKFFIIYTNSSLNLDDDMKLVKKDRSKAVYPFKFDNIIENCEFIKDILFTNNSANGRGFYKFSKDKQNREELLNRIKCSFNVQNTLKQGSLSEEELKNEFLDKLIFAVNQPSREELKIIIKKEIKKTQVYTSLQKKVIHNLKNNEKLERYMSKIMYENNLLMYFLHNMFLNKKIGSICTERKPKENSNDITIKYRNKTTYVRAYYSDSKITFTHLFPARKRDEYLNKYFELFAEKLKANVTHFIIYTNAALDITVKLAFRKLICKWFCALQFCNVDIEEKQYKLFRNNSCFNDKGLYKFSPNGETRENLLNLLKLPTCLENKKLSAKEQQDIKISFLDKLIFAVNQPRKKDLKKCLKSEIKTEDVPYKYEELHEISLRWSESHVLGPITKQTFEKLSDEIQDNLPSYNETDCDSLSEEINLAKHIVAREGTSEYDELVDLLINEGCLATLNRYGLHTTIISSLFGGSGPDGTKAFKEFYYILFDDEGNPTECLENLDSNEINLVDVCYILTGARSKVASAFKDLYELWFDNDGNKTKYLRALEEQNISIGIVSIFLNGSKANAAKAFTELYNIWFDEAGNKTRYLKALEEEAITLSTLTGAKSYPSEAFKALFDLWFDEEGNKTKALQALEKEDIKLSDMCNILTGPKGIGAKSFHDLYSLWFDDKGHKTQVIKTLENKDIGLRHISAILRGSGHNAVKAFNDLYDLWFDKEGNTNRCLQTLEEHEMNLISMASIFHGAGIQAAKCFKNLYDVWFDEEGNKRKYLSALEEQVISLIDLPSILTGEGANAARSFKELCNSFLNNEGEKVHHLKVLESNGINIANLWPILTGAGYKAPKVFKDLYYLWFDKHGNKTEYLRILEDQGLDLLKLSTMLHGAGARAPAVFKDFYYNCFDDEGNKNKNLEELEEKGFDLVNISTILDPTEVDFNETFNELHNTFGDEAFHGNKYFEHFVAERDGEQVFKVKHLIDIFTKTGAKTKDALENLHNVCFDEDGKKTELLDDFYKADFKPSHLSSLLHGTGVRAATILRSLHSVCFNKNRKMTTILKDFLRAGFTISNLCGMLNGSADSIQKLHNFCFIEETKMYLNNLLNDEVGFTPSNLAKILHGSGADICSVLKELHDICFLETGETTKLMNDFTEVGFRPSELSNILAMKGSSAPVVLIDFYSLCNKKDNYLFHLLEESTIFTPKKISKILSGVNCCYIFEKLHDICFDESGNITKYLKKLMAKYQPTEIINILHEEVRKVPSMSLGDSRMSI